MPKKPKNDFTIIFEELDAASPEQSELKSGARSEATPAEIAEIAELRRIVLETTEVEPSSFTCT